MTPKRFDHLHALVEQHLAPVCSKYRRTISSREKLALVLHYLGSGDSQQSEAFDFRLGRSTVSKIVKVSAKQEKKLFPVITGRQKKP